MLDGPSHNWRYNLDTSPRLLPLERPFGLYNSRMSTLKESPAAAPPAAVPVSKARAFVRFTRPHTIIASTFQVAGLFVLAAFSRDMLGSAWLSFFLALLASLAANLYIVGLNQITDVDIDRLNKPKLPLASGDFSMNEGWAIVLASGAAALLIALSQGAYLLLTLSLVMLLGTVYSLPPLRLKRLPLMAALCIALARGLIANLGLYAHFAQIAGGKGASSMPPLWMIVFFFGFGLVIALFKDIPDWLGDREFAIRTFTVRWGQQKVFNLGRLLLTALYLLPLAAGARLLPGIEGILLIAVHIVVLLAFWRASLRTEPTDPASMTRLYLGFWTLFYAEYVFIALSRVVEVLAS